MAFEPISFLDDQTLSIPLERRTLNEEGWFAVIEHSCTFWPEHFLEVALNLIKNPNLSSSHLFRADVFFDSLNELTDVPIPENELAELMTLSACKYDDVPGFRLSRRIILQLIPRNPQLDRSIAQTCLILETNGSKNKECVVVMVPHVDKADDIPWYHPGVKAVAFWYQSKAKTLDSNGDGTVSEQVLGTIAIHYQVFPDQHLPLINRELRSARHLLQLLHKHGQGSLNGYQKKGQHDQLISQKRVQDTYTALKAKHAKRLCSAWVEQTEPTKHVFEDLGIAAYLIELWRDMYAPPGVKPSSDTTSLPSFPGFVDIGCGNGVLVEVLILSGYAGQGFDARRRKTWSILSSKTQGHLHEMICVPQPLFDLYPSRTETSKLSLLARARALIKPSDQSNFTSSLEPPSKLWHNGLFPTGTFIISNHADELTPWTPLLACLTRSPFLAIPCCSHNLTGARFRAPSACNSHTADAAAPPYFAAQKKAGQGKSIPITLPQLIEDDCSEEHLANTTHPFHRESKMPETGSLRDLSCSSRANQPSAYSSLCDWIADISWRTGYVVEKDMLRIPSTRNIAIIGRMWRENHGADGQDIGPLKSAEDRKAQIRQHQRKSGTLGCIPIASHSNDTPEAANLRKTRVHNIVVEEDADGVAWVRRCEQVLAKGGGVIHGRE